MDVGLCPLPIGAARSASPGTAAIQSNEREAAVQARASGGESRLICKKERRFLW